jgi:ubiquinone biosynthesis protein
MPLPEATMRSAISSGNLFAQTDARLGLVDFGEVGFMNDRIRDALVRLLGAVLVRDSAALGQAVVAVSRSVRDVDRQGLGPDLDLLLRPLTDTTLQNMRLGRVLGGLLHVLRRYGLVQDRRRVRGHRK